MKAMILAAGRGERMGSLTSKSPKPLIQVNGVSLIERNIKHISEAGIKDIVININWLGDQILEALGTGERLGVKITYMDERKELLGTGGGILNSLSILGENPFWLINADVFSSYKIDIRKTLHKDSFGHLILVPNPKHNSRGDFFLEKGKIRYMEGLKPYTYSGISLLSDKLFKKYNKKIFPLEPLLIEASLSSKLTGELFNGLWIDVGTQERLNKAENLTLPKETSS